MVGRIVEGRKAEPVAFDFGAVRHVEADRAEDFLDAHPGAHHRMDSALGTEASRQRHVDRFARELGGEFRLGHGRAALVQKRFDFGLGAVDFLTAGPTLFMRQLSELLHERGQSSGLAEKARLGVFERGGLLGLSKSQAGGFDKFRKFLHSGVILKAARPSERVGTGS